MELLRLPSREAGLLGGVGGREEGAAACSRALFQEDSWSPLVGRDGPGMELWEGIDVRRETAEAAAAGTSVEHASEMCVPPSKAFVMALSFIGLRRSSSELSVTVGY